MSFAGDLEHLPIVDVIQLLHSTRKTGTLCLRSSKGESQLVFNDGYIVSANHVQNTIRIGQILVEMSAITPQQLEQALERQRRDGDGRKPLVATLIEGEVIDRQVAFAGLEALIEMTIVEVLTWTSGTFALDVDTSVISDEYRYFPEILQQKIQLNTQNILMDALRIYDEKMRDGTLEKGTFPATADNGTAEQSGIITADVLGLEDLEKLEKKIPDVFLGLKEYDASEIHRQRIREALPDLSPNDQSRLFELLREYSDQPPSTPTTQSPSPPLAVIAFSNDPLITHMISTVCRHEGVFVFSTDDASNLDPIIDQSFAKELIPLLVIDAPLDTQGPFSPGEVQGLVLRERERYPHIPILQLVAPTDQEFPLLALQAGVRGVLARPPRGEREPGFVDSSARFMKAFHLTLRKNYAGSDQRVLRDFKEAVYRLEHQPGLPELAFVVLGFAATMFERTLTLVVRENRLVAEKSFGVRGDRGTGASEPLLFSVPLGEASVFRDVLVSGRYVYGHCTDAVLRDHLHAQIGMPRSPKLMLMPIKALGRVVALIYGDFGDTAGSPLQIELLDIVARHAGLLLDISLYRKRHQTATRKGSQPPPRP